MTLILYIDHKERLEQRDLVKFFRVLAFTVEAFLSLDIVIHIKRLAWQDFLGRIGFIEAYFILFLM